MFKSGIFFNDDWLWLPECSFMFFTIFIMITLRALRQWSSMTSVFLLCTAWPSWRWPSTRCHCWGWSVIVVDDLCSDGAHRWSFGPQLDNVVIQVVGIRLLSVPHQLAGLLLLLLLLHFLTSWILFWNNTTERVNFFSPSGWFPTVDWSIFFNVVVNFCNVIHGLSREKYTDAQYLNVLK